MAFAGTGRQPGESQDNDHARSDAAGSAAEGARLRPGILTGSATDVGTGPDVVLLSRAFWPLGREIVDLDQPRPSTNA